MFKQIVVTAPGVQPEMLKASYWWQQTPDAQKVLLTSKEISSLNQETRELMKRKGFQHFYYPLEEFPEELSREELSKIMSLVTREKTLQETWYDLSGKEISAPIKEAVWSRVNLEGIKERVKVSWGITIRRTALRALPTDLVFARSPETIDVDLMQLTALTANTPLAILHSSRDGQWLFVQSPYYLGWVKEEDLALVANYEQLYPLIQPEAFLVVTGNRLETEPDPYEPQVSNLGYQMGDKLPLASTREVEEAYPPANLQAQSAEGAYVVRVPVRDAAGYLQIKLALIPRYHGLHEGYLPYTRQNILKQAFKMLGERYGWGGMFNRRDCSRFILDIYRTMGVYLPRDAHKQEEGTAGKSIDFKGNWRERLKQLAKAQPGDPLYMPGHVLLYLGELNGQHYVIHDGAGYALSHDKPVSVHGVFVMDLDQLLMSGKKTYLEALTRMKKFY